MLKFEHAIDMQRLSVQTTFRPSRYRPSKPDIRSRFLSALKRWRTETEFSSSTDEIIANGNFRQIVSLGRAAIPHIISEIETTPDFLFVALAEITGEDPVPNSVKGNMNASATAWIDWFRREWP